MHPQLKVEILPALHDNYIFLIVDPHNNIALVVDPADAQPVISYLRSANLNLGGILITHHHNDHIAGALQLKEKYGCKVFAPKRNRQEIPFADSYVEETEHLSFESINIEVISLPGHTQGHIAFFLSEENWLFSGDVLFGLGCGRVFEGTYEEMYHCLQKIKTLPQNTLIFCAHEYTEKNYSFCTSLQTQNVNIIKWAQDEFNRYRENLFRVRQNGLPSVPIKLSTELKNNPFLLAKNLEQFSLLRDLRNNFQ